MGREDRTRWAFYGDNRASEPVRLGSSLAARECRFECLAASMGDTQDRWCPLDDDAPELLCPLGGIGSPRAKLRQLAFGQVTVMVHLYEVEQLYYLFLVVSPSYAVHTHPSKNVQVGTTQKLALAPPLSSQWCQGGVRKARRLGRA